MICLVLQLLAKIPLAAAVQHALEEGDGRRVRRRVDAARLRVRGQEFFAVEGVCFGHRCARARFGAHGHRELFAEARVVAPAKAREVFAAEERQRVSAAHGGVFAPAYIHGLYFRLGKALVQLF